MKTILFKILASYQFGGQRYFMAPCPYCGWPVANGPYLIEIRTGKEPRLLACFVPCTCHTSCSRNVLVPQLFGLRNDAEQETRRALYTARQSEDIDSLLTLPSRPTLKKMGVLRGHTLW
ncbi:MAG: hypothetical protein Greene041679_329 [Parcubacteria group bacterium Greene0416_79]|nr:MAG: hypothetical protein Greene041679_329 [Parcubacteria group bacterium Greene0416_79]